MGTPDAKDFHEWYADMGLDNVEDDEGVMVLGMPPSVRRITATATR